MQPIKVGVRDAKIHLSRLLDDVQGGREIIITNHGRPIGKIIPVPQESLSLSERIAKLEQQGLIESLDTREQGRLPSPLLLPDEIAQKFLQEDRDS